MKAESALRTGGIAPRRGQGARTVHGRLAVAVSVVMLVSVLAGLALVTGGCKRQKPLGGRAANITRLNVGDQTLVVEVAHDNSARRLGLMHRESLAENQAMLFIFPVRERRSFWMKNTTVPLSIAFLSEEGEILQIEHMKPEDESSTRSKHKVRHALEVNRGWFDRHGVGVGDRIESFEERVREFPAS